MSTAPCQIHCVGQMSKPLGVGNTLWQRGNRLKRIIKRRWHYLSHSFSKTAARPPAVLQYNVGSCSQALQPGDLVRVRSVAEIQATLNKWHQLKGCSFMEEMWPYCNTMQKVLKRVEKFLDERDYLLKKTKGIIILEKVFCQGTRDFGSCDRTCFFFWREEWLEKMEMSPAETSIEDLLVGSAGKRWP
jgi:hypothetical protein